MSMTVTVTFLSGQMVPVVVQTDASADELKSRVQHACQVGIRDIVSQQGKLVQGSDKLCDKGVQDGDVLTATVHGTRIITRFASLEYPTGPAKWGSVFAAIRHDGHVLCWGNQRQGTSYKRVQEKLVHVLEIAATEEAFAATLADGSVVTWGDSEGGGDSSAVQDQLVSVRLIKATAAAFAALRADGHVVTWGCESFGGDSAAVQKDLQDVVAISTTEGAFAAKRSNGTVVTWGRACDGGDSRTVQHLLREVQQITACAGAFAALCSTAELVVWGSTQAKMLRSVRAVRASWGSFAAIRLDGSVVTCGQAADGGDSSGVQELLVGVQEIQASASAFAALRSDGRVVAWGDEENGSDCTAVQTQLQNVRQLRSTWSAFAALRLDGRVVTWGSLDDGADISSIEEELVDVVEVVATAAAFAALRSDGSVVTWGDAEYGGDCSMVQQQLQNVNEITASWRAFAAIRADGLIVAWGNPEDGGDTSLVQDDLASFRYGDEKGARNMSHALGDCYADDWAIPDAFRVASVLLRQVQSGSVAVLHMPQRGFRQHTLEVLRHFLQGLAQRQLRAVTLSQLADAALLGQKPAPGGAEDNEGQFSQSNHHRIGVLLALLATSFLCWPQQPRRLLTLSLSWSSSPLDAGWVTAENPGEDFNRQDYEDELSQAKGPLQVSGIDLAAKRAWTGISEPEPEQCCAFFIRVFQPICLILCESPLTQSEEMIKEATGNVCEHGPENTNYLSSLKDVRVEQGEAPKQPGQALAQQASSGEKGKNTTLKSPSLPWSSGGYSYWGFLPWRARRQVSPSHRVLWPAMFSWCLAGTLSDESSHEGIATDLPETTRPVCETHKVLDNSGDSTKSTAAKDFSDPTASMSTAASSFDEGIETEDIGTTMKLSFKTPQDHRVDVYFNSKPLCLRFSKSMPLTVTGIGTEFSGSARVMTSWVLTHVDDVPVDMDYKYAACQIREIQARHCPVLDLELSESAREFEDRKIHISFCFLLHGMLRCNTCPVLFKAEEVCGSYLLHVALVQITASTVKSNGGWVLQVKVSKAKHVLCNEIFGFFTGAHFRVGSFPAPIGGTKTFTFDSEKLTESQIWDVDTLGIRVFTFQENPLATVRNILETALLFVPDQTRGVESYFAKRNVEFLRNYVGASLKPRKDPGGPFLNLYPLQNAADIRSGDFLGVLRLDGLDPMLAWGSLESDGILLVGGTDRVIRPTNGIQRTPYQQWIEQDVGCRTAPFLSLLSLLFWRPSVLNRGAYPLPPCAAFSPPLLNEDLGKTALFSPTASQGRPRCATQHEGVHYSLFLGEYPDRGLYVIGVLTFYELDPIPPGEYLERGLPVRKVHDSGQDKEGAIHKLCASYHGGHNRDVNDPAQGAANAFFHKYEGLEYGYHAMLTGWIDTLRCKPPYDTPEYEKQCLTWEFIEVAVPIITRYIPTLEKPFLLTWNQHVTGSSFSNLSATALYREARLGKIPAVPEPDGILYPSVFNNGTRAASIAMAPWPQKVCDVFVCSMWKAGGVFKAIDNDFSCIEQTNVESQLQSDLRVQGMLLKDVYDLNVLEAPSARKDTCVHADPENPLCQLTGVYGLELPKLGTRPMYRHMCLGNLDPGVL
ncbi:hypothetical protein AK812_SmicGene18900 [Symbiodinium microadriaticum]|uniref:Ubiquitin-like domain-containing protein n=1 Tax=Symbiodinium microadriaticum TaxID=2951 RepID=A0A1Q9DTY4_SYMMI|nr:hypothetical protein AK812_SmicGene18900 [Symbiodinium microadriaticum]